MYLYLNQLSKDTSQITDEVRLLRNFDIFADLETDTKAKM